MGMWYPEMGILPPERIPITIKESSMKILLKPTVTVVGHTKFIPHPTYSIPDDGDDSVRLGSFAAKGCYDSFGKEGRANVENQKSIMEHRHGSVMEHATVSLFIEGISRALTLEMNRHRTFAISQRSTRYTKEDEAAIVLEPYYARIWTKYQMNYRSDIGILEHSFHKFDPQAGSHWRDVFPEDLQVVCGFVWKCKSIIEEYKTEVDLLVKLNPLDLKGFDLRKWARGKARNILPHALETRVTYTNNHRGWRWFIESRSDKHAEPEIRRLAFYVWEELHKLTPEYYSDFEVFEIYDDIPVLKPKYSKI